ncbi:hypothetical protein M514_25354 [Trichuris suis]|uniref:Reverse transcriptase domain-containing protein n=1 Tax=Trichuris suis TaxID=68888 RepID=A0A085MZ58_9BILA|nr:hypothetical protein M514_25354 [Trichuris suis]
MVDTGCSKCVAYASCCRGGRRACSSLTTVDGKEFRCEGTGLIRLQPAGRDPIEVEAIVTETELLRFDFILGMNGITALGGVTVVSQRRVQFGLGSPAVCVAVDSQIRLDKRDLVAMYSPDTRSWTAAWKWSGGMEPGVLRNTTEEYSPAEGASALYEKELEKWIENGWLVPYGEGKYRVAKGLIPLMAVIQRNKGKVRLVMDFRESNGHVETFTADSDVCARKTREWWRQGTNVSVVDLKKAYLQIRVDESLWPYQTVMFRKRRYCLTRLSFGLNVAPLIMKAVLNCVLSQDSEVERGTSAYVDDILVNEDVVPASRVEQHLVRYGLSCKSHERVTGGA